MEASPRRLREVAVNHGVGINIVADDDNVFHRLGKGSHLVPAALPGGFVQLPVRGEEQLVHQQGGGAVQQEGGIRLTLVETAENVGALLHRFKAHAVPIGNVAANPLPVFFVHGNHGGDVIVLAARCQPDRQLLGIGGFSVFGAAGDEYNHVASSTVNLSPWRISSR